MIETQVVPVDFGQGLDRKTDPKLVVIGKMLLLENAIFTEGKGLVKRNGYSTLPTSIVGGGNLAGPNLIKSFKNELVVADSGNLYTYSPDLLAWTNKGVYVSIDVTETFVSKQNSKNAYVDSATLNNVALYCWDVSATPVACAIDLNNQNVLLPQQGLASAPASGLPSFSKCVALGSTAMGVVYLNASNQLVMRILSVSAASVNMGGSEFILATDIAKNGGNLGFDIATTSTGAVLAYGSNSGGSFTGTPNQVTVKTISAAGAIVNTFTQGASGAPLPVTVSVDASTGNVWVYWLDNTTPASESMYYLVLSPTLTSVLAKTTIGSGYSNVNSISIAQGSSTQQSILWGTFTVNAPTSVAVMQTKVTNVFSNGTIGTTASAIRGVVPVSKAFTVGTKNYMCFTSDAFQTPQPQPTLFIVQLGTYKVVARLLAQVFTNAAPSTANFGHLFNVNALSGTQFLIAAPSQFQLTSAQGTANGLIGTVSTLIDFASQRTNMALESSQSLILNGACLTAYDGQSCTELGYNLFPEVVYHSTSTTGGSIGVGTYNYYITFQWYDAQGNVHESSPTAPLSVTIASGSTNSVTLGITMCYLTQKTGVNIAIFRTAANGTIPYLITDPIAVQYSDPTSDVLVFTDTTADPTGNAILYTTGNVVQNSPPPPSMILGTYNNRLLLVDAETPNVIWYSKTFSNGNGASMSGLLTIQINPNGGNISALVQMDEKLIILKDRLILFCIGDGANDTGTGSSLTPPQIIPSDTGCNSLKSLILTPRGLIFKSPKGIYLMDRGLGTSYIGMPVEAYNSQTVTSAVIVQNKNHIRFLTDSGLVLIYDYIFDQWSVFTNHNGYAADNWNGLYAYVRTDGFIFQESTTSYLDNAAPFQMRAQTSWLSFAGVQGFERVRRFAMLGDFINGLSGTHGIQISIAYNFQSTFSSPIPFVFGLASSQGIFQFRERLPIQKCNTLSLLIEEIVSGVAGEFIDFSNLSFEVGIKQGLTKLRSSQSNG